MANVSITPGGRIALETGSSVLNPNSIIVPFDQDISVVFLSEGMSNTTSDLGWFILNDAYDNGDPATGTLDLPGLVNSGKINWLFHNIEDDKRGQ